MKKVFLCALGIFLLSFTYASAQGPYQSSALGYWTRTGCPTGTSPCFKDYDGTSGALPVVVTSGGGGSITSVVSAALEASHVLKASSGSLYSVYVTDLTGGTSGFLLMFNATSAPADGAVTPLDCIQITSSGNNGLANQGLPPSTYSTGITAVVSSGADCFHKTTGVLTAYINGKVL